MSGRHDNPHHFYRYSRFLDETNAQILAELAKHGPRNISTIAKATNLPITTVSFRLKKLIEHGLLRITANPNLPRLGLAKAFLTAEAPLGQHGALLKIIKNTDYWTYITRCYGRTDGYCAYFAFPATHKKELEDYLEEATKLGHIRQQALYWTTNSYYSTPNFQWYNFKEKEWKLEWQEWINDIQNASSKTPEALIENKDYETIADKADLLIIKELEKDATIDLKRMAILLQITPQGLGNRYKTHIIRRQLVAGYNVDIYPFPIEISELYNFILDFTDPKTLAKFVNASNEKPFMVSYAKAIDSNTLITNIYIERKEFPNLNDTLNQLHSQNIIRKFSYITLEPTAYHRQTISYEHFENGKWSYDSKEKMRKLQQVTRST